MRKVYLKVVMSLQMTVDDGVEISDVMDNMFFVAEDNDAVATVEDFVMVNYEITDSK
jgi:hypothetical protein